MVPCITVSTNVKGRFDELSSFPCLYQEFNSQDRKNTLNNLRRKKSPEAYINLVQSKCSSQYIMSVPRKLHVSEQSAVSQSLLFSFTVQLFSLQLGLCFGDFAFFLAFFFKKKKKSSTLLL